MKAIYTIVGMQYQHTESLVASMKAAEPLTLIREPTNQYDPNAVQVWGRETLLGYVKGTEARALAHRMDAKQLKEQPAIITFTGRWPCAEVEER
jgi:hypothetical protein